MATARAEASTSPKRDPVPARIAGSAPWRGRRSRLQGGSPRMVGAIGRSLSPREDGSLETGSGPVRMSAVPFAVDAGLFDRLTTAAWVFDIDRARIVWANRAALAVWSADDLDALKQRDMGPEMSPAVARRLRQYQDDFGRGDSVFSESWTLYPGNVPRHVNVLFSGVRLPDGRMGMFCEAQDEVARQPDALRSADALLHTQVMISLYAEAGGSLYRNPAARAALGPNGDDLRSRFVAERDHVALRDALDGTGEVSHVWLMATSRGPRWHEVTARGCYDPVSGEPAWLISEVDVSTLKETEDRARYIASHDTLTRLPNRSTVTLAFTRSIAAAERGGNGLAVFFLDLDQFKVVNDSLGHSVGDRVLAGVADRLVACCGDADSVIRLGGDEFLLIVARETVADYEALALSIVDAFSRPMEIDGHRLEVTPSIGISLYPQHGSDSATLMMNADLAMYAAKADGRNCWRVFVPEMRERARSRSELESAIKAGLQSGEFEVYYQPRVRSCGLRIVGAEALVRWNHPQQGLVMPATFIPLCEETGLIDTLGLFVLRTAMRDQKAWSDLGWDVAVSINISQRQLANPMFSHHVEDSLASSGCQAGAVELEITESLLMQQRDLCIPMLERLRGQGLRISIDDFGTGYSNLARLHEFAIDCIKIDRSFVKDLPESSALPDIIISLCRLMRVKIVAEGVETLPQLLWLQSRGCDEFQGYHFSKPVPLPEFHRLLETQTLRARQTV
ncbi:MAG: putative bifunctional diguanylate cyclase/phosphodiesterase [Janthinobacterium lividum]